MRLASIVGAVLIAAHAGAPMAAEAVPGDSPAEPELLNEVVVSAKRLAELRDAVIAAEDSLLARYNELNQDRDLAVRCSKYTPTGTRFAYRYCATRLQQRAQEKDGSELLAFLRNAQIQDGQDAPLAEMGIRLMERSPEYRSNLIRLLEGNPDLRELIVARGEAQRRYEAARKKR